MLNDISEEELSNLVPEVPTPEVPTEVPNVCANTFSPMEFMHCPRGVGRPKKKRFGAPSLLKSKRKPVLDFIDAPDINENNDATENPKKRGRGRPKGSKNQNKDEPADKKQRKENVTKTIRQRAEDAAYELDEDSEMCLICSLKFTDQIKQDKDITRCPLPNLP